jgi:hypothetical protein
LSHIPCCWDEKRPRAGQMTGKKLDRCLMTSPAALRMALIGGLSIAAGESRVPMVGTYDDVGVGTTHRGAIRESSPARTEQMALVSCGGQLFAKAVRRCGHCLTARFDPRTGPRRPLLVAGYIARRTFGRTTDGSFRRNRPWRPHSQDGAEDCPRNVRRVRAVPGGRSACVPRLSAHQRGRHGPRRRGSRPCYRKRTHDFVIRSPGRTRVTTTVRDT